MNGRLLLAIASTQPQVVFVCEPLASQASARLPISSEDLIKNRVTCFSVELSVNFSQYLYLKDGKLFWKRRESNAWEGNSSLFNSRYPDTEAGGSKDGIAVVTINGEPYEQIEIIKQLEKSNER